MKSTTVARAIGMQAHYVNDVANGRVFPGLVPALKIEVATGGAVDVHDWLKTPAGQAQWHNKDKRAPKRG